MSTLSAILLTESRNILNQYSGLTSGIRNFGFTRELVPQVSRLVNGITTQRINLHDFAVRLRKLEGLATEDDVLRWYIQEVRKFIALTLQNAPEYLFFKKDHYKFYYFADYYNLYASAENSHAFITAYDLLITEAEKTVALEHIINLRFGLYRLMTDEPVRTVSLVWEKYKDKALNLFFNNASSANSVKALLDLLASLPHETNNTPWQTTIGSESGESLLSLTMEYAPERYNEVLGYLEGLSNVEDKAKILLYSRRNASKTINPVLSACINYPNALPALLTAITALPNKVDVNQFLKDCLNLVCQDPARWVDKHFKNTLIPRAEHLFAAILALPDTRFVFNILTMHITDYPWKNMARYIIQNSPKMFVQMLETIKSFDVGAERTQLLQMIFQEAMHSEMQARILIHFLLSTPELPKDFLQITAPGSNWNILHIVARYCPNQVASMLECIDKTIPEYKGVLLAGLTNDDYTSLMLAAKHGAASIPYFLDAITVLPSSSSILQRVGQDNSSALTLVNRFGDNLTGNLINDAIEGRYKNAATSSSNPLFFQACKVDQPGTAATVAAQNRQSM